MDPKRSTWNNRDLLDAWVLLHEVMASCDDDSDAASYLFHALDSIELADTSL